MQVPLCIPAHLLPPGLPAQFEEPTPNENAKSLFQNHQEFHDDDSR